MTDADPDRAELEQELDRVDAALAAAEKQLDDLRRQRSDPTEWPDTADDANSIREFEDQESIVADLQDRRAALARQLST